MDNVQVVGSGAAPLSQSCYSNMNEPQTVIYLNCWVLGHDTSNIFPISITSAGTVGTLKDLIKEKKKHTFDGVDADCLDLWQVNLSADELEGGIQPRLQNENKISLSPMLKLSSCFSGQPDEERLHIVIGPPPSISMGPPPPPTLADVRKAYLNQFMDPPPQTLADVRKVYVNQFMDPPSMAGRPDKFADLQGKPTHQIFCSRPREIADPTPVTLLEPIFAQFVDDCQDYELTDDDHAFAVKLSHEMCRFQPTQPIRMHEFWNIFYDYGINLHDAVSSAASTDGHLLAGTHVKVILVGKNEIPSGDAEPFAEGLLHYRKSLQLVDPNMFEEHKALFPCFHLICIGACIGILGTVFSTKVQSDILVPIIPLFWHSTDLPMITMAVRTLAAFKAAVKKLEALPTTTPEPLRGAGTTICPYPRDYVDSEDILQKFTYDKDQPFRERLIFYGTNTSGARICVKFSRMYSPHAHRFCASKGHAPQLIAYRSLPGGWNMVVMDFIDISSFPYRAGSYQRFMLNIPGILSMQEFITTLIKELHAEGYVHGDLREANIFVRVQGTAISNFMLVDFDWAGPVGEIRYPPSVNRLGIYRPENARGGHKVLPEDDLDMLRSLFVGLKRKRESTPDEAAAPTSWNT